MLFLTLIFVLPVMTFSRHHRFQYNPRNIQCHCVPPTMCSDDDVAMNGYGLLDPRMNNHRCSNPSEVCCDTPEQLPQNPDNPSQPPRCGYSSNTFTSRIISKTTASFGELPWSLIIQEIQDKGNIYKCGASLIHPKVAVTAAHCVFPYSDQPEKLLVRAGEWNVDSHDEPLPIQDNYVEEILVNYDYRPGTLQNDIALLVLSENFELRDNVRVMCLSTPHDKIVENACVVSGWGKDAYGTGRYSSTLKKVQVPIISRDYCLRMLRTTKLGARFHLHKSFICAGGKRDADSCKGDGGSPLICPLLEDRERFVQIGIVSWGVGCGKEGVPGVYVNVPFYLEWIEDEMDERELDTGYFKI